MYEDILDWMKMLAAAFFFFRLSKKQVYVGDTMLFQINSER